ncbi:hypothetical protein Tco_0149468 [Tanacetum coccineum]
MLIVRASYCANKGLLVALLSKEYDTTLWFKGGNYAESRVKDRVRKSSSLQLCMQLNKLSPNFGCEPVDSSKNDSGIGFLARGNWISAVRGAYGYDEAAYSMRGSLAVLNFPVEMVKESLKKMKYGFEEGCSPVVLLKKRYSQKNKKGDHKVVLEDLGADYLEQLLDSTNTHCA